MKPFYKQKTFWLVVAGQVVVAAALILNKVLNFGFSTTELATGLGSISAMVVGFVGAEKFKDAKVVAAQIETAAKNYGQPLAQAMNVIAAHSDKGKAAVDAIKEIMAADQVVAKKIGGNNG
jgi:hypothetical protein